MGIRLDGIPAVVLSSRKSCHPVQKTAVGRSTPGLESVVFVLPSFQSPSGGDRFLLFLVRLFAFVVLSSFGDVVLVVVQMIRV